jgi:hypothetical protein
VKYLLAIFVLLGIGAGYYLATCPCERLPGMWLQGTPTDQRVVDWQAVNDKAAVPLCQVEVSNWRPHSINLNCMSFEGGLYVSCSRCEGKVWSQMALNNPKGKIKVGASIHPVSIRRVENPGELDNAWHARAQKLGADETPRPDHWWSFQMSSRVPE